MSEIKNKLSKLSPSSMTRIKYTLFLFTITFISLVLKSKLILILTNSEVKHQCGLFNSTQFKDYCETSSFAYRISFSLVLFFLSQLLLASDLTCCAGIDLRVTLQNNFFFFKWILFIVFSYLSLYWIPFSFFNIYGWICLTVAIIFMVIQMLILMDMAYHFNDVWIKRGQVRMKWIAYIIFVTSACYIGYFLFTGLLIHNLVNLNETCKEPIIIVIVSLILSLLCTIFSIIVPHGSLFPSSIMCLYGLYTTYFTYKRYFYTFNCSIHTIHNQTMNITHSFHLNYTDLLNTSTIKNMIYSNLFSSSISSTIIDSLISAIIISYIAFTTSEGDSINSLTFGKNIDSDEECKEIINEEVDDTEEVEVDGNLRKYCYFHIIMIMSSMYIAMLVSGWAVTFTKGNHKISDNTAELYMKMSGCWLAFILYFWSLISPYTCCSHRDYGYED